MTKEKIENKKPWLNRKRQRDKKKIKKETEKKKKKAINKSIMVIWP